MRAVLDEAGFQQLLAAAYVVQQHNDRLRLVKGPGVTYTKTLSEIVETEGQIKNGRLNLPAALRLIVERARRLTRAEAAAVALVDGMHLLYRATSGHCADEVGSRTKLTSALAARCLRNGVLVQSPDTNADKNLDGDLCWRKGVRSLIAAPVLHEGKPVGILELRFASPKAFQEEDVRTCELMAGLVALALSNEWNPSRRKLLAGKEEAALNQAVERFTPHLERMLGDDIDFAEAGAALSGKITGNAPVILPPNGSGKQNQGGGKGEAREKDQPKIVEVRPAVEIVAPAPEIAAPKVIERPAAKEIEAAQVIPSEPAAKEPIAKEQGGRHTVVEQSLNEQIKEKAEPTKASSTKSAWVHDDRQSSKVADAFCQNCGREFVDDETLCGTCGTQRVAHAQSATTPQTSTWSSLWDLQESNTQETRPAVETAGAGTDAVTSSAPSVLADGQENRTSFLAGLHELRSRFLGKQEADKEDTAVEREPEEEMPRHAASRVEPFRPGPELVRPVEHTPAFDSTETEQEEPAAELSSFSTEVPEIKAEAETQPWWEHPRIKRIHDFWEYHRATIYLALAAILLLMVLLDWDSAPAPTAPSSGNPQTADMTLFDRMLVNMGLAEVPTAPTYPGNPDAKVWVDVHTALYYCPGADLYGKTKGGRYASQKDAQQDAFEPAGNRACK